MSNLLKIAGLWGTLFMFQGLCIILFDILQVPVYTYVAFYVMGAGLGRLAHWHIRDHGWLTL